VAALHVSGNATAAEQTQRWDHEADVVCVGSGAAAGTAAVTATALGASVIVLEKMPLPGGTTGKSGGIAWIPNNQFIRAAGQQDNREDCLRYMARFAYPKNYDANGSTLGLPEDAYQLLAAFYDNGYRMVDWMERQGALKFGQFRMWSADTLPPDYLDHVPENKASNARSLEVAAGGYGGGGFTGGAAMIRQLEAWLLERKVPMLLEHRVVGVIKEGGRAIGVEVQNNERLLRVRARKGVIFGTGGYSHSPELIWLHQPGLYGSCAATSATGDFIPIAQQAGARMGDLTTAWRTPVVLEQALENRAVPLGMFFAPGDSMIHVNRHGKRVVNEKRNYNDRTRAHFVFDPVNAEYPNLVMIMVFDERTLDRYAGAFPLPVDRREANWLIEGGNTQELTQNIARRLDGMAGRIGSFRLADSFAANLDATLERFNRFAETGRDEDFDRGLHEYDRAWMKLFSQANSSSKFPENDKPNRTMYPIDRTGPLYAVLLAPGSLDTSGGPAINADGQVIAADGSPVPGLYGAGNCVASATGPAYMGAGGTIGPAMTFGYLAAHHALGRKP
jgi:succinate dehydrogenase/fumarate reductase flavoprotein subunit